MLGPPKSRRLDQPIGVSLEELVPADHCSRPLEARLDLDFVRARVFFQRPEPFEALDRRRSTRRRI